MLIWTPGFFLGLQFTHMDFEEMQKFKMTSEAMKEWGAGLWIVFIVQVTAGLFYIIMLSYLYCKSGVFKYYVGYIFFVAALKVTSGVVEPVNDDTILNVVVRLDISNCSSCS